MKKINFTKIITSLAALAFLCCYTVSLQAQDGCLTAGPATGAGTFGFQTVNEQDILSFNVVAGNAYSFATDNDDGMGSGDSQLTLYNADFSEELAFDDDGGPGLLSLLEYTACETGTVNLYITQWDCQVSTPDQQWGLTATDAGPGVPTSAPLEVATNGGTVTHCYLTDADYYAFQLCPQVACDQVTVSAEVVAGTLEEFFDELIISSAPQDDIDCNETELEFFDPGSGEGDMTGKMWTALPGECLWFFFQSDITNSCESQDETAMELSVTVVGSCGGGDDDDDDDDDEPCAINCPGDINLYLDPGECCEYLQYEVSTSGDCSGVNIIPGQELLGFSGDFDPAGYHECDPGALCSVVTSCVDGTGMFFEPPSDSWTWGNYSSDNPPGGCVATGIINNAPGSMTLNGFGHSLTGFHYTQTYIGFAPIPFDGEMCFDYTWDGENAATQFLTVYTDNGNTYITDLGVPGVPSAGQYCRNVVAGEVIVIGVEDLAFNTAPGSSTAVISNFSIIDPPIISPFGLVLEYASGPVSGEEICEDAGVQTVVYVLRDVETGEVVETCSFDVQAIEFQNPVSSIACNDLVQVSVDRDCEALITPDMILEGGPYGCYDHFTVTLEAGATDGIRPDVAVNMGTWGATVEDENGNYCWGSILVEDKLPPTLECSPITLKCTDLFPSPASLTGTADDVVTTSFASTDVPTDIFTGSTATSTVNVTGGTVSDVDVSIDLNHAWWDDLDISLIAPDGTTVDLMFDQCGSTAGQIDVTFDDEAGAFSCATIGDGISMQANDGVLSDFDGVGAGGTWTLSLTDDTNPDSGTLNAWSLSVTTGPSVTAYDNCARTITDDDFDFYDETILDGDLCGPTVIERTWTVTDYAGNTATCTQEITIEPLTASDINTPPSTVVVPCGVGTSPAEIAAHFDLDGRGIFPYDCSSTTGAAYVTNNDGIAYGYPYVIGGCGEFVAINPTVCNLGATYTDQNIPDCAGDKVIRLWQILDWCNPVAGTIPYPQIIKVIDDEDPYIDIVVNDEIEITESTDPWGCDKVLTLPHPEHVSDNCGDVSYWVEIPGITNDPFNLPFSETKSFGNPHYFPADMIDQDSEGRYVIVNAPKGRHLVTYYAEDECGNISTDQIYVNILDETPPVAIAKQNIVISLTSGSTDDAGIAKLYVNSIDNGSHDGCSEELYMEIRREDANDCWNHTFRYVGFPYTSFPYASSPANDPDAGQYVKFCCEDLGPDGYGEVRVVLRVWDDGDCDGTPGEIGEDNYNDTWATIRVEDKLPPTIQCPPDVTIDCDEDYLDFNLTGTATAYTTCGAADPSFSDRVDVNACGVGVVTRTWSIVTTGGAASCIQKIYIDAVDPFAYGDITWPVDMELDCAPVNAGEPTWNTVPCSLVGSSLDQQVFEFEDGSCYKELNHWTVIDWCTYDPDTEGNPTGNGNPVGIWNKTQIVKVIDTSKPVIECEDYTLWAAEDCLAQDVELTKSATDNGSDCPSDWLKWEVCLDVNYDWSCDYIWTSDAGTALTFGDNVFYVAPTAQDEDVVLPAGISSDEPRELDLPIGEHRVVWTVHDGCGNVSTCVEIITVEDGKAPTPYCIQNLSTAVMDHGEYVDIWAIDFNLNSTDNCPGELRYTFTDTHPDLDPNYDADLRSSYARFTCEMLGDDGTEVFTLSMYVWDASDLYDFCFIQLRVDDNLGVCGGGDGRAAISGLLTTEAGDMVDQTDVSLNSTLPEFPIVQTVDGEYAFVQNPMFNSYEVTAEKNDNYLNGVSTLDLVLIQKHILGLQLLNSPYKVIAADINSDQGVSALDLVELRKLILGIIEELPNNNSWRFVDASQEFADVNNPWPFTETLAIDNLTHDMMSEDFVAAKIGDVSGDVTANLTSGTTEIRSNASLNLMTTDRNFAAGDVVRVDITSEEFNDVYGYQFTMNYTGLEYAGIEAGALNMTADNFGLHRTNEGMISTSWASSESVSTSEVLFSVIFTATANGQLSESISIGSAITPAEAYRGSGLSVENVSIEFRTDNGSVSGVDYVLYQNEPNPFAASTVIGFELPTASEATISVYDVTGKVIKVVRGDYAKGYNEVTLKRNELNSAGVLYYQLESGEYTATKKMILID